jgi:3-deoxy-D-manno-octulosonic-acid transferase
VRRLYSWLITCAAPFAFAVVLWRGFKDRGYWQGLAQRFGGGPAAANHAVWLHAVSLGEMSAAAPLIRDLLARHPHIPLVLSTATPAGRARGEALFGAGADIRFLPYDTPGAVRRFLTRIRPRLAIIMETELWPNLFSECERRGVPVILASARLSEKSVSRYRRLKSLFGAVFTDNVLVAAQSTADAQRFNAIGADARRTQVVGNVKFDVRLDTRMLDEGHRLRTAYGASRPVWIAGSTHAGEEEQLLEAHALLRAQRPSALLLLAPRHKDRFEGVAQLLARRGVAFVRRSSATTPQDGTPVVLVDTVGELVALYAAADVAFVGGSLVAIGGHNLLEPAALGLPVLTGPSHFNAKDIAQLLLARGAALQVANARDLAASLQTLLDNPAERQRIGIIGKQLIDANRGSVARLLELMEPWLASPPGTPHPPAAPQEHPSATR